MKGKAIMKRFYYMLLLAIVILNPGCTEDSSDPTQPPTGAPSLGTLTASPDGIVQNIATTIKFQLNSTPGISINGSEATLNKKDAGGNLTAIGLLKDNGDTLNGDEIANDGVFTGKIQITEGTTGNINFVATASVTVSGQSETSTSSNAAITVYNNVSIATVDQNKQTLVAAKSTFITSLAGNPNNYANAMTQTKNFLASQPGVSSASYTPNSVAIEVTFSSGIKGGFLASRKDAAGASTQGGALSDSVKTGRERVNREIPEGMQTRGDNAGVSFIDPEIEDNLMIDPTVIGNRNVLIYTPYRTVFWPDKVPVVKNALNQATCKGFKFTEYSGQDATVKVLEDITKYGFVFMDTHGLGGEMLFTAEKVDILKPDFTQYYLPKLLALELGLWEKMIVSHTGTSSDTATVYVAYSHFFTKIPGSFQNSVIFNSSCESAKTMNLKNAFFGKGAKAYYGYSEIVYSDFAARMIDTVARRFARGLSSDQAYFDATDPHNPYSAHFEYRQSDNMSFALTLVNGDYEATALEGWTKEGDGRVITKLGPVNPTQGSRMGIISTGLGYTTSSGSISQCLKIENNQSSLILKWNFLSEEFLEFIHSQYQDYFRIKLIKSDGAEVTLFSKNIDQLATQFGADTNQIGQLVKVSPGIVFDRGDVYMTNWQTTTLDVTPYRGQTIVIVLICGDIGDSIYDTAILLDEVKIQ